MLGVANATGSSYSFTSGVTPTDADIALMKSYTVTAHNFFNSWSGTSSAILSCQWSATVDEWTVTITGAGTGTWSFAAAKTDTNNPIGSPDTDWAQLDFSASLTGACCGASAQATTGTMVVEFHHKFFYWQAPATAWSAIVLYAVGDIVWEPGGSSWQASNINIADQPPLYDGTNGHQTNWDVIFAECTTVCTASDAGTGTASLLLSSLCCSDGTNCTYTGTPQCTSSAASGVCNPLP